MKTGIRSHLKRTFLTVMLLILVFFVIELIVRPKVFYNSIATGLFSTQKLNKADDIWYDKLDENDGDPIPEANYAKISFKQGNYAEAQKYSGQALRDEPENPVFLYDQGNSQYRQEQLDEALESYKKAMLADPHDQDAKSNYELVLNRQGYKIPKPEDVEPQEFEEDPDNKKYEYENTLNALDQKEQNERQQRPPNGEDKSGNWW